MLVLGNGLAKAGRDLPLGDSLFDRIGEDRRSGVLELLLTTGLSQQEIIEGQRQGGKRMFRPVLRGSFRVLFLFSLGSLLLRGEVGGWAWLSFLLAWIVLSGFLHEVLNMHIQVMWIRAC